jgi:peptidoglycan/LPS O-acetylase OafA/YrhL
VAAGIALIVFGVLALVRTGVNSTWYEPVEQVLGMDHTPLLGAVEIGAGVLLVLAGLTGARMFAALVAAAIGVAATIVAIEPDVANPEFAIERDWAIALAVGGFVLAFILVASRERRHGRRVERRSVRTA